MESSRRTFIGSLSGLALFSLLGRRGRELLPLESSALADSAPGLSPSTGYVPVQTLGIPTLPYVMNQGAKEFHLEATSVVSTLPDGSDPMMTRRRPVNLMGYNQSTIGPTIEAVEGDRVRVVFTNRLSEGTTVHFHGIELPIEMDGVPGLSQDVVQPGGQFIYEFTVDRAGTFIYHPHFNAMKQIGLGMMGFFVVHPRNPLPELKVDRDYAFMLHTIRLDPGSPNPDVMEMSEFNYYLMNGRVGEGEGSSTGIPPMKARVGERVRVRVSNLSMLTHPIHLHGHTYGVSDWGGGYMPQSQWIKANTINISAGEVRTLEFVARAPGKWMFHCHFTHHLMNDMHRPSMPGDPSMGSMPSMEMGGMSTWIEVT